MATRENRTKKSIDDMPDWIVNSATKLTYIKQSYIGRGSFAKCFKVLEKETKQVFALKCIPSNVIKNGHNKNIILGEIHVLKSVKHENIVRFHNVMTDDKFVYIALEYCEFQSLHELILYRKTISVDECRYYLHQIISGVEYLHNEGIIHRDIKLSNIFLDKNLKAKIGDFGLAICNVKQSDKFYTVCGTPNYISPEIISGKGYSFEVDIWSIGCVMYTLLVGRPPFQTSDVRMTYQKIVDGEYTIPKSIDPMSKSMIISMLEQNHELRPNAEQLLSSDFFTKFTIPKKCPSSNIQILPQHDKKSYKIMLKDLKAEIGDLLRSKIYEFHDAYIPMDTEKVPPPLIWITKWVDYSLRHGFGYELSNGYVGVRSLDSTNILMSANEKNVIYIEKEGQTRFFLTSLVPACLEAKLKKVKLFKSYMAEKLFSTSIHNKPGNLDVKQSPHMITWLRNDQGSFMYLSTGSLQVNFLDHIKIVICPSSEIIKFITPESIQNHQFNSLRGKNCPQKLYEKLLIIHRRIDEVINNFQQ